MKALSIQPFYANLITIGAKWIELRTWDTNYRGWLAICASKAANKVEKESMISGHACAIAHLSGVRPFVDETDREDAFLFEDESFEGYSWVFDKIIPIKPVPIKGQLRLFNIPYEIDDLELIDIDYDSDNFNDELINWWLDNGFIKNKKFFEHFFESEDL